MSHVSITVELLKTHMSEVQRTFIMMNTATTCQMLIQLQTDRKCSDYGLKLELNVIEKK